MTGKQFSFIYFSAVLLLLASCKGGNTSFADNSEQEIKLEYTKFLKLKEGDGYIRATVINPWDSTRILAEYILVPDSAAKGKSYPTGTIIRYPLDNALIYSSIHADLISELGEGKRIGGVCDSEYIYTDYLKQRIASGSIRNCGQSAAPDIEKIIQMRPDAIFLSPYENSSGAGKLESLGIPIVQCADYMEVSPLAQAEWMRFYGILFGKGMTADSVFRTIEKEYISLKNTVASAESRPKVLLDLPYGNSWNVPASSSTMGILLNDAGAENLFAYMQGNGSRPLTVEQVYMKSKEADIWLVRYNQSSSKDLGQLAMENPLFRRFKPYIDNNVYGSNTRYTRLFEDRAFHPQYVLKELCTVFHPEIMKDDTIGLYFEHLKP